MGVKSLGKLPRDLSDRNRTSPFAFTGNKFEFRAVGSSQACARPGMIMNAIMADSMNWISAEIEKELKNHTTGTEEENMGDAIDEVVTRTLKQYHYSVFNGNGYSEEWVKLAEQRGLKNLKTSPEAIREFANEKNIKLFEDMKVLSRREVESQQHTLYENFSKTIAIEADCLIDMVGTYVVPAVLQYKRDLVASLDVSEPSQANLLNKYNKTVSELLTSHENLKIVREKSSTFIPPPSPASRPGAEASSHGNDHLFEEATFFRKQVMDAMDRTRVAADTLETMVDDKIWPFPKYHEILLLK